MATKVLSIEIGQGMTRVVEMDYKAKKPKIYNSFTFMTPRDVINDGVISTAETFVSLMKSECGLSGVSAKKVIFSVTSSRIASREVKLPLMKEKQIQDALNANATDFFPIDVSQYHLAYRVLKKVNTAEEKALYLNVLAVPNEIPNSYLAFAKAWGVTLVGLDYVGNSIYQAMQELFKEGIHAVLKVEERSTLISIVSEGTITFQRTITYGINEAIEAVLSTPAFGEKLTYGEAVEVLCGKSCIRRNLNSYENREEEDIDIHIMKGRIKVTQALEGLIMNVNRILEYYQESNDVVKIDEIHLIGLGGDFSGLSRLMSNELQQKVRAFRGEENSALAKIVRDNKFSVSSYVACLGAAINPLNILPEQPKTGLNKEINLKDLDPFTVGVAMFVICLVIAIGMAGITLFKYNKVKKQVEDTQAHIEQMKNDGVEVVYNEYITLSTLGAKLDAIYGATLSRSEDLVAFIEELEEKMPSSIIIMNFSANSQGVSMSMTVDSKEEAAKTLMQLKTFTSIDVVSSTGLTESTAENEETTVSFSVSCTYKPVGAEDEALEIEAEETGAE